MTGMPDQQQAGQGTVKPRSARQLFRILTFTARYDAIEDRLRLDAVDAQGGKQAIYLTRRLVDRVIPVLVSHLEGKTPDGVPSDLAQGEPPHLNWSSAMFRKRRTDNVVLSVRC